MHFRNLLAQTLQQKLSLLSDQFDIITASGCRVKLESMYQERVFIKLGTIAASFIKSINL